MHATKKSNGWAELKPYEMVQKIFFRKGNTDLGREIIYLQTHGFGGFI
jgi:hypothetical protein